jgi:hypothetical protein
VFFETFLFWSCWLGNVSGSFEESGAHLGEWFVPDEDIVSNPAEEPNIEK